MSEITQSKPPAWIAFVAPFAAFMVLSSCEAQIRESVAGPWAYLTAYGVKFVAVAGLLIYFRRCYPPFAAQGLGLGLLAGAVGVGVWVMLCRAAFVEPLTSWIPNWLMADKRAGFDPVTEIQDGSVRLATLGLRFAGLVLLVPMMEEVFWRGFLARWIVNQDFEKVEIGRFTMVAFVITTAFFAAVHLRGELFAAVAWGSAINLVCMKTKNLWACVVMHATTNLLLGIYIVKTGAWTMW